MKRLITSLALALTMSFASVSSAAAAHFWELQMFTPTQAVTSNTFTIEYKAFSVEQNDDFVVTLFQNNAGISVQNTTKDYGDSGVFTVTVPAVGTYNYHVSAVSSVDGTTKSTSDRTMTVTTTPQGTTNTIFVPAAAGGAGGGAAGGAAVVGGGAGAGAPAVAGAAAQAGAAGAGDQGTTGTEGATTGTGDVLGAEKQDATDDKKGTSAGELALMIGLPLLALAAAYYILFHRRGQGPLAARLKSKQ